MKTADKLSFFLPSLAGGGAERSMARIASGLSERDIDTELVLGRAIGPFLAELSPRVRVVDLRCDSMPRAVFGLARHLKARKPTVLISAMTHANIAAALAHALSRSSALLVLSERVHLGALLSQHAGWRMDATGLLLRWVYPRADKLIAVSQGVADDVAARARLPVGRVFVAPNPVFDDRLLQQAEAQPTLAWLDASKTPLVVAAGRLEPQKDFATLLRAFALLRARRPARLLILGEGAQRPELERLGKELRLNDDDLAMPGFNPNPFPMMRLAAMFVLSSRYEGLPGVLIQAMACGVPVVATDCPSGPSEVLEGGRWGRLVPVGQPLAMAEAMLATLDDCSPPDVRQGAKAYSTEAAVSRYADLLCLPSL